MSNGNKRLRRRVKHRTWAMIFVTAVDAGIDAMFAETATLRDVDEVPDQNKRHERGEHEQ